METLAPLLYLVSSVLFILALRGLSHPETSRQGLSFGMFGMTVAILTTLMTPAIPAYGLIVAGIVIGGTIGTITALKIKMTALPQLVAAFHSLVGLAAVCVAIAAFHNPEAYGIGTLGDIHISSLIEMSLGVAIGAVTFSGSIIAWGKLQGVISGKPLSFSGQHLFNTCFAIALILMVAPVRGLRPVRAARLVTAKVPKPTIDTLPPFFKVVCTPPIMASSARVAAALEMSACWAMRSISSVLFTNNTPSKASPQGAQHSNAGIRCGPRGRKNRLHRPDAPVSSRGRILGPSAHAARQGNRPKRAQRALARISGRALRR